MGSTGVFLIGLAFASACTTQHSALQPYVRDIRVQPGLLVVDSCALAYTKHTNYFSIFGGGGTTREVSEGNCIRQTTPVSPTP